MQPFEIAIIGAGPAGAWAATRLAQRGARVALVDASHPREKPCGGGITGRALAIVGDAIDVPRLPAVQIRSARFVDSRAGASADVALDARRGAPLVVSARAAFDARLYEAAAAAGATLIAARARDVVRDGRRGFVVHTDRHGPLRADWIVGADGANSLVRRRLAQPFARDQLSIATGFFAHGATSNEVVIELLDDPPGYIWSFPRPDHLAIGICAQADAGATAATLRSRVGSWIAQTRIADGARLEPYSWPIPSLSAGAFDATAIAGDRWLTIGDAAGLVDPITREGIFFALQSAACAADALAGNAARIAGDYTRRVRADIVDDLRHAARLKRGFFRPQFTRLLIRALQHSASIREVMADLVAGTQPYHGLKWRLLKTFEFQLALRVLTARGSRRAPVRGRRAASR